MFSDEAYAYAGLVEVRDATPHTLREEGIDPRDVDEALDLRAVFRLQADGYNVTFDTLGEVLS